MNSFTSGGSLSIYMEMSAFVETDEEKHIVFLGNACQQTFDKIKIYLIKPHVLTGPMSSKLFLIYVRAMDHVLDTLLAQINDKGHK